MVIVVLVFLGPWVPTLTTHHILDNLLPVLGNGLRAYTTNYIISNLSYCVKKKKKESFFWPIKQVF